MPRVRLLLLDYKTWRAITPSLLLLLLLFRPLPAGLMLPRVMRHITRGWKFWRSFLAQWARILGVARERGNTTPEGGEGGGERGRRLDELIRHPIVLPRSPLHRPVN